MLRQFEERRMKRHARRGIPPLAGCGARLVVAVVFVVTPMACPAPLEGGGFATSDFQPDFISAEAIAEDQGSLAQAEFGAIVIRAKYYEASGDYEKAKETYRQAIAKFPDWAYAYLQLANLLLGRQEMDSRIQYLEKAIELDPRMKEAYEAVGLCYTMRNEIDKAISTYAKAVQNVEDTAAAVLFYSKLAEAYLSLEKAKEAEDVLLEACARHAASPEPWLDLMKFYLSRRQSEKADETFEKALKATGNSLRFLRGARDLYHNWKRGDRALAVLERTLELYPESSQSWLQLVRQYLSIGEKEKAKEAAQKAIAALGVYDEDLFSSLAVAYVNAGEEESAIAILTEGTNFHGGSPELWRSLAALHERKGETKEARECYRKLISIEPSRIEERRRVAFSYLVEKDYESAIKELLEAVRLFPNVTRLKVDLANVYLASGQFEEGEKVYLDLVKARPGDSDAHLLLANYYLKGNRPEKMEQAIQAAVQLEKEPAGQARVFSLMGQAALERKEIAMAISFLQEAANRKPDDPSQFYALAQAHLLAGDREKGAEHLRKAIELTTSPVPEWLLTLGKTYRHLGKKQEAEESFGKAVGLLKEACEKDPKNSLALYALGQAYETVENDRLAAEAYFKCVQLQPENGDLRYKLATVYSEMRNHQEAQKQLERAIKLPSPKPEWFVLLGEVYGTTGRKAEASKAFEKAISLLREELDKRPEDLRVWAATGEAYSSAKDYPNAVEALRKAIELAGERADFRLHIALARALESSGENEAAKEQYLKAAAFLQKAAEENPSDPDNFLRLGLIYQRLRDSAKSAEALSKGIELAGGEASYTSYVALADSLEKSGKPEMAKAEYQKAHTLLSERIKEHPDDIFAHYMLANVCEKVGDLEQCEREYRKVIELDPYFAAAYNNLGYTWIDRDLNLEEAISLVRKALELEPDNGAYIDSLGWAYFKLGKLDEALSELQRALKFEGTDPAIYEHIGDVYKAKNMIKEAIEYWQKALQMNPLDQKTKEKIEKNQNALPSTEDKTQPEGS